MNNDEIRAERKRLMRLAATTNSAVETKELLRRVRNLPKLAVNIG